MAHRLANSLVRLRSEIDALAPNRSRRSDGWIGDAAHLSRASRHNPNRAGVVTALDLTHDPGGGCDIHAIAERIRQRPHPNLAYIISNRRIASKSTGWRWHTYTGSNPHSIHVHFGVGVGSDSDPGPPYDDTKSWGISAKAGAPPQHKRNPPRYPGRPARRGDRGWPVGRIQRRLSRLDILTEVDSVFGEKTERNVKALQQRKGITVDGVVGPVTWKALWPKA